MRAFPEGIFGHLSLRSYNIGSITHGNDYSANIVRQFDPFISWRFYCDYFHFRVNIMWRGRLEGCT
jgi:hypothetical protein